MNAQIKQKEPTLVVLNLTKLELSQTPIQIERRAMFDQAALKELSATIAAVGRAEQPIVVRPLYSIKAGDHYEVVDGERRVLATEMAELGEILAEVRDLTDEQVEQIQIVTGLQKEGLHELVEAEGYEILLNRGQSVEEIAAKCGKSKGTVYARMKLLALSADCRKAFREGSIEASVALLLARIPGDDQQARALKHVTELDWHQRPMSYRDAASYVHETFMLKLSEAPFPREDETLVEGAGPCSKCPMRTGNAPDLFGDVKGADVCTNPPCFQAKKRAHISRELEKAKATGDKVIRGADAKRILPDKRYYHYGTDEGRNALRNGYARPSDKCLDDPKKRTYAELAGKDAPKVLLQDPNTGRVSKVFEVAAIADKLKAKGIKPKPPAKDPQEAREQDQEHRQQQDKLERQARCAIFAALFAAAPKKLAREDLANLLSTAFEIGYGDDEEFYAALGWTPPKKSAGRNAFRDRLLEASDAELAQLAVVLPVIDECLDTYGQPSELNALAKRFGVDVKQIRAEVAPPKPAPAKKASKKKAPRKAK